MTFLRSSRRPDLLRGLAVVVTLALVTGAFLIGGPAPQVASAASARDPSRSGVVHRQIVHPLPETAPGASAREGRSARSPHAAPRSAPTRSGRDGAARAIVRGPHPKAHGGPSEIESFRGLDKHDAGGFYPPDTQIARSPTKVMEAVNGAVRLFKTSGSVLDTLELRDFFGARHKPGRLDFVYDPKLTFDANGPDQRIYAVSLQHYSTAKAKGKAAIWLAISRTSDPKDLSPESWCRYRIDARSDVGTDLAGWPDFPGLGIGADTVAVSANQFSFRGGRFTYTNVRVIDKIAASMNGSTCPSFDVTTLQPSGKVRNFKAYTLQPAQHATEPSRVPGEGDPLYLVNTSVGKLPSSLYRVWRITGGAGPDPEITHVNLTGPRYNLSSRAPQKGTSIRLDAGDVEILQVVGRGDELVATHTVRCAFRAGTPSESCVRVIHVDVKAGRSGELKASLADRVTTFGGGDGWFYFDPAVAMNAEGTVGVSLQSSIAETYLSARWTTEEAAGVVKLARGTCPDTAEYDSDFLATRTGDYTGVQVDPSTGGFWFAGERAAKSSGRCGWQTKIVATTS
jgi:hypothetical protein